MPSGKNAGLLDTKYKGMSAEQIYDVLPDKPGGYSESDLIFIDPKTKEGKALKEQLEEGLLRAEATTQVADANKSAGSISADLKRMLDKLLKPKLNWKVILQDYMNEQSDEDYSMQFPDEEYLPGLYVPTLYSEGMGELSIYVDVSGSISSKEIDITLTEINMLKETLEPTKTKLVSFDTEIHLCKEYDKSMPINIHGINVAGGGGTELINVAKQIVKDKPKLVLILTDGWVDIKPIENIKNADLIWLIFDNENFSSKSNRVIHINIEDYQYS